jgi:hypothetical protein
MPAINSRSERGSVQLAELSLLLAAVRGPPNPPVPLPKGRTEPSRIVIPSSRDREFEPVSLQRRVSLSPASAFEGREIRLSARVCAASFNANGAIDNIAIVLISQSPSISMTTVSPVVIKANQVCGLIRP